MSGCERHDSLEGEVSRLRDDVAEIYGKVHAADANIIAINMRLDAREADLARLENQSEKNIAKLEGMIQTLVTQIGSLAGQISEMKNAGARKIAARWDDTVRTILGYLGVGVVAFIASLLMRGISIGGK